MEGRLTREAVRKAETDALVVTIVEVIEARRTTLAKKNDYGMCRAYLLCCWIMRTLFVESRYCMPSQESVYHCSSRTLSIWASQSKRTRIPSRDRR